MINKDECTVVSGGDGSWMLKDPDGRMEAYLPAGFATNEAAATPLLMMCADHYNRGFGQAMDARMEEEN